MASLGLVHGLIGTIFPMNHIGFTATIVILVRKLTTQQLKPMKLSSEPVLIISTLLELLLALQRQFLIMSIHRLITEDDYWLKKHKH